MRTTITLDADTVALIKESMKTHGLTFKEAVNRAIRQGLSPTRPRRAFRQKTHRMGFNPKIPYDKTLALAGELENQEILRKLALGK